MYKVSVIVPVFGVEKYIETCAKHLFEQTLQDIEYIFVDDCTHDNSINILEEVLNRYPERKKDVVILHHDKNKGLPQARKTGILQASGEYLAHCDSDDWVDVDMYNKLYAYAKNEDFDIVSCDYFKSDGITNVKTKYTHRTKLLQGPLWNKLVKRSLYKEDIVYPISNKAEDGALMTQLCFFAKKIGHVSEPLYYYFLNPTSMTREISEEKILERFKQEKDNTKIRIDFLEAHNGTTVYKDDIIIFKSVARNNLLPLLRKFKYYNLWLFTYPEINMDFLICKEASKINRIEHLVTMFGVYNVYCYLSKKLSALVHKHKSDN